MFFTNYNLVFKEVPSIWLINDILNMKMHFFFQLFESDTLILLYFKQYKGKDILVFNMGFDSVEM